MCDTLLIRRYEPRDLHAILEIWEAASRIAHAFMPEQFFEEERWHIPNTYLPNTETWVVEENGRVLGFTSLIGNELGALFVTPDEQGSGIGRALVGHARALHEDLCVEVFAENKHAYRFYRTCGFKDVPPQKAPDQVHGHQLLRLVLST